jgi:phytoene desaturase
VDWEGTRERYFDQLLAALEQRVLPGLTSNITTRLSLTPLEFERDLRSVDGAAFGPEPLLTQSAYFRYHNRSEDVAGLYFVGAGTHPGAGVPGVLNGARVLDRIVP